MRGDRGCVGGWDEMMWVTRGVGREVGGGGSDDVDWWCVMIIMV